MTVCSSDFAPVDRHNPTRTILERTVNGTKKRRLMLYFPLRTSNNPGIWGSASFAVVPGLVSVHFLMANLSWTVGKL